VTGERERLEQERDQALRDLVDLDRQVAVGELPDDVAAELRSRYERAAAATLAQLAETSEESALATDRSSARARWGAYALALAVAAFAAVVLLPTYLGERVAGGAVSGNEALGFPAPDEEQSAPRDPSTVTDEEMEAVIAENPGVVGMRLALAHRYLDAADYLAAARHYVVALDQEPRNVEAQAHYGWLLMQLDEPEQAAEYVDGALAQDPQHVEALWFRANIALYGLSDPATAITVLEQLQQRTDLEPEVRDQVEALLAAARGEGGQG
jgi:cytochrome c-type biogenesis protein CcmH/NrfG